MAEHSVFLDFPCLVTLGVADKWLPRFLYTLEVDCIRGRNGSTVERRDKEATKGREKHRTKKITLPRLRLW